VIEVAAFAVLAIFAAVPAPRQAADPPPKPGSLAARLQVSTTGAGLAVAGLSVIALVLLGIAVAGAGGAAPASAGGGAQTVHTVQVGGTTVVANAKGFTLYWFAPDTATKSNCNGSCAAYWPPVKGPVTAGPGVTGTLGTIKRADGSPQATYNGRPLYTYVGDTAPGQAHGNALNLNGGLWHEVTPSG
jgi:predicted lipoprotein with Yx(FWY)xxD motif